MQVHYLVIQTRKHLDTAEEELRIVAEPTPGQGKWQCPVFLETGHGAGGLEFVFVGFIEVNAPGDPDGDYVALLPKRFHMLPDSQDLSDQPIELIKGLARHAGYVLDARGLWVKTEDTNTAAA